MSEGAAANGEWRRRLEAFPRVQLAHVPTPLELLPNLEAQVGEGRRLLVKRDDCTGLALGGNKARQLEFYFGEAKMRGADVVLITGAVQSNFVRQAAAAARKLGMDCHVQLEERVPEVDAGYRESGNVLLDHLLGAVVHSYPEGEDEAGADAALAEIAAGLADEGRRPYVIPLGPGHPPLGALGYVRAAIELIGQFGETAVAVDEVVVASGSGNTHAGLLFGLRAMGWQGQVTGICVRRPAMAQRERIADHCRALSEMLELANPVNDADIVLIDEYLGPGYGRMNVASLEAIRTAARTEGLLLDPVYTAKAMAGFLARAGAAEPGETLLFVHTGGQPALFAYGKALAGGD